MDDNNSLNIKGNTQRSKIWERWEKKGANYTDDEGNEYKAPSYRNDRLDLIQLNYKNLSKKELNTLAANTASMTQEELFKSVEDYLETKFFPEHSYRKGTLAFDTRLNMPKERPFNPYKLAKEMNRVAYRKIRDYPRLLRKTSYFRTLDYYFFIYFKPLTYILISDYFSISGSKLNS